MSVNNLPIICFAGCDWWYHNRGLFIPQVMTRLAKQRKVLFINSLGMRIPSIRNDRDAMIRLTRKLRSILRFLRKDESGMYVVSLISLPVKSQKLKTVNQTALSLQLNLVIKGLGIKNPIYYIGCPPAWEVVKNQPRSFLVYEKTDLFEEMPGIDKPYIKNLDYQLTTAADLVLYVNTAMWQDGLKKNPNSLLVGHGVDFERFVGAELSEYIPEDIKEIPRPIIGYFGDIDQNFCDFSLIEHIAKTLPNMSLVLIGPVSSDLGNLKAYENIFFLGHKPHDQIPHYGKVFDVAIMPWKQNRWIEFCNPIKTKEYLALGKPTVSIDYPELKPYHDIVYASSDYDQFIDDIRKAVKENDPHLKTKRQERVKNETWDNKVRQITEFIDKKLIQPEHM